jgi:hypothetical protein
MIKTTSFRKKFFLKNRKRDPDKVESGLRTTYKLLGVLFVDILLITSLSLSDGGAEEWSGKMRLGEALSFSGKPALAMTRIGYRSDQPSTPV